ncbi:hypothetical protein CPB85DRAFT_1436888 [Mucidula mucida]|nr:hypothetical protein CPB85DRAFT_1436888 [Mucidula mucida]
MSATGICLVSQYIVEGITNEDLPKYPQPTFATSNDVQVVSDCPTEPFIHKTTGLIVGVIFGFTFVLVCVNVAVYLFHYPSPASPGPLLLLILSYNEHESAFAPPS